MMARYLLLPFLLLAFAACKSGSQDEGSGTTIPVLDGSEIEFSSGSSYYFGQLNLNSTKTNTFTLTNNTSKLVESLSLDNLNAPYSFSGGSYPGTGGTCAATLYSGDSCTVVIEFTPTSYGQFENTANANYSLGGVATTTNISFNGYGAPLGEITFVDGASYSFGSIESGNTVEYIFSLENNGPEDASEISPSIVSPFQFKGGSYPGSGGTCTTTIASSTSCTLVIEFAPSMDGTYSEDLVLSFNNSANLETSSITLEGVATSVTPPDAVSDLSVASTGLTSVNLSWTTPNDNGSTISDYTIEYKLSSGSSWSTFDDGISDAITATVTGLSYSTAYDFRIRAFNGAYSSLSNEASGTTDDPPDAVTNLSISSAGPFEITLGWSAPNDNGTAITDYQIEYKLSSGSSWSVFTDGISNELTATVNGLSEATSYDFRIRAYNGAYSGYSNVATGETTVDDPFFDPTVFKAMNLGGATDSSVVAFEDGTTIELNGSALVSLNAGETHNFTSALNDIISADKAIFVAGRKGSGSDAKKGNMVWSSPDWAGKTFAFTGTRSAPHKITVYAFEDATINVKKAGSTIDSTSITTGNNHTFSINDLGSFVMESSGLIVAHMHSNASGDVVDPKPLLPASTDIIGIPSQSLKLGSLTDSNNYNAYHSNSVTSSGSLKAGTEADLGPEGGSTSQYQAESLRIIADSNVFGNSNADSDGLCAAPFVPVAMMKKRFAINVTSEWVAFASLSAGDITVIAPDGSTSTLTMQKTGSDVNAPYKARLATTSAGTRFEASFKFQAWYEPDTDVGGANEDESVMFGAD